MDVFALLIVPLTAAVFVTIWALRRSRQLLEDWAFANDVELLSARFCWFRRGPFFWTSSNNQTVYRITVIDDQGETSTGWARCGSFWWGLFTARVDVRWDEE